VKKVFQNFWSSFRAEMHEILAKVLAKAFWTAKLAVRKRLVEKVQVRVF